MHIQRRREERRKGGEGGSGRRECEGGRGSGRWGRGRGNTGIIVPGVEATHCLVNYLNLSGHTYKIFPIPKFSHPVVFSLPVISSGDNILVHTLKDNLAELKFF
jgi:hypothetical protein